MRTRLALPTLFLALLLSLASRVSEAYPISPVPLWDLVERADIIVLADVVASERVKRGSSIDPETGEIAESFWKPDAYARLAIRETWKGEAPATIEVGYRAGLICPTPPRYDEDAVVIAFLGDGGDGYHTIGLSYGTVYPHPDEVKDFRRRIREAIQLQGSQEVTLDQRLSWLARTAASGATRWHGLYELNPSSDRIRSAYDRKERRQLFSQMSVRELELIADGFVAEPSIDRTLPMALETLVNFPSEAVDNAALAAMEAVLSQDEVPWWALQAMRVLLDRLNDPYLVLRFSEFDDQFPDSSDDEIRQLWQEAKEELGIPTVAPVPIREEVVWGRDSNTPS